MSWHSEGDRRREGAGAGEGWRTGVRVPLWVLVLWCACWLGNIENDWVGSLLGAAAVGCFIVIGIRNAGGDS